MRLFDRRSVFLGLGASTAIAGALAIATKFALAQVKDINDLKPGEFTWHPERSPDGPLAIIVSIPDQRVHVYRNGIRIGVSTCSTGKAGHATPTGVFTILEKDKDHHSSTYNNAPMPNMNRITWNGVALHAGNLPGFPASHGCVRLPMKFSELLFGVTHVGTPVIVAGSHADPIEVTHPGLVLAAQAEGEFNTVKASLDKKASPWQATVTSFDAPTSIIVSSADQTVTILSSGDIVAQGRATIRDPATPLGSHVFVLTGAHDGVQGLSWIGFGHGAGGQAGSSDVSVLQRISATEDVLSTMRERMHPGMVFVTTDLPAHPDTRSGRDFVVMGQGDS